MAKVRFLQDFDWRPAPGVILAYRAGCEMTVTRRCAERAVAAGKAVKVRAKRKQEEASDGTGDDI